MVRQYTSIEKTAAQQKVSSLVVGNSYMVTFSVTGDGIREAVLDILEEAGGELPGGNPNERASMLVMRTAPHVWQFEIDKEIIEAAQQSVRR